MCYSSPLRIFSCREMGKIVDDIHVLHLDQVRVFALQRLLHQEPALDIRQLHLDDARRLADSGIVVRIDQLLVGGDAGEDFRSFCLDIRDFLGKLPVILARIPLGSKPFDDGRRIPPADRVDPAVLSSARRNGSGSLRIKPTRFRP